MFTWLKLIFGYFNKVNEDPIKRKIDTEKLNSFDDSSCQHICLNYYSASMESLENTAAHQPGGRF